MKAFFRLLIGALFGLMTALALAPALAAFHSATNNVSPVATLLVVAVSGALGFFAPTIRRAFGRGFLLLGVSFLALPLSAVMLSGRAAQEVVSQASEADQGAAVIGAGIAGVAITGAATFIGLIFGAILVITGLVLALGGRREVVIIERVAR